jgi:hypothetical protein
MKLIALEIAVSLVILLLVAWLQASLTQTRSSFVPLVIGWGAYLAARLSVAATHGRGSRAQAQGMERRSSRKEA